LGVFRPTRPVEISKHNTGSEPCMTSRRAACIAHPRRRTFALFVWGSVLSKITSESSQLFTRFRDFPKFVCSHLFRQPENHLSSWKRSLSLRCTPQNSKLRKGVIWWQQTVHAW